MRRKHQVDFLIVLVAVSSLILGQTATGMPAMVEAQQISTLSGSFSIIMGDSREGGSYIIYYLVTNVGEWVQIFPMTQPPLSYQGRGVRVTGIMTQVGGKQALSAAAVTLTDVTPLSTSVSGTRRISMLLLRFNDSAASPDDPVYYSNLMNPTSDSVDAFFQEDSYGLMSVQADVYGWYTLPRPRSYYVSGGECRGLDFNRLIDDGVAVADPDVYFPQYDDVSFVMSDHLDGCAWGGGLYLTADGVSGFYGGTWMPPWAQNVGVYAHEEGHAIGCPHTGWVYGSYDSIWDVESGGSWFNARLRGSYYSSATGYTESLYSYDPCHHVAYHKIMLGWLDEYYSEVSTGITALTVNALAGPRIGIMAVKVDVPGLDPTSQYFTIEARTKINYDQWLPGEGVIIHFVDDWNRPVYPVDSTPLTHTLNDAEWLVGMTYSNHTYGLSISMISRAGDSFLVQVSYSVALASLQGFSSFTTGSVVTIVGDISMNPHGSKPSDVVYQQGRDTTPLGYIRGMLDNPQPSIFDTNGAIDINGRPIGDWPLIFSIGGPGINAVTHYYETTPNTMDQAPVKFTADGSDFVWRLQSGTEVVRLSQSSTGVPPGSSDVFVIQILKDADDRLVVLMYGTRYTGTWAAAEYFKFHVYSNISTYTDGYYIVQWTDVASGTSANLLPDSGDTFTILAQGTP